jgi:uncharacterized protein involved in outer membrane biogenesis
MSNRWVIWLGGILLVLVGLILVLVNISNWNWFRAPLSHYVANKTGRELVIGGDLIVHLGWRDSRISTRNLTFSNPAWAHTPHMVSVKNVTLELNMPSLLRRSIQLDQVHLDSADISLEKSLDGRKNWLLDKNQKDEKSRIQIHALAINQGRLMYKDPALKTDLQAELSTTNNPDNPSYTLIYQAHGQYLGERLRARGNGGSLLSLRDENAPYPLRVNLTIGPTSLSADGHITNLLKFSALDLRIDLRGGSLSQLYPILGIVLPDTPPYQTRGRLLREAKTWRYEKFSGHIGKSDIAGTLEVNVHTHRPMLTGSLHSNKLNFADLGPLVGAKKGNVAVVQSVGQGRVLPTTPFRTERWDKMDADITLTVASIVRNEALPINNLSTHLRLNNALLTLDPLKFGVAGGTLAGLVKLDGRTSKIEVSTDVKARKIRIAELFPTLDKTRTSIGLVNGDIDLKGTGNTIASMLGSADGRLALVVNQGEISKLMMEAVGLHLLEMLQLKIAGDKNVKINCGVADFGVKNGVMTPNMLMLDTDVTRINASGMIDLGDEKLDLIIVQKSKKLSLVALRPPIHIRGNLATPNISLDKSKLATRGLGAIALGLVNPLLALLPLIEPGKDKDADCGRLIRETKMPAKRIIPSR